MRNYELTNFSRSSIGFEPFFSILNGASRRLEAEGNGGSVTANIGQDDGTDLLGGAQNRDFLAGCTISTSSCLFDSSRCGKHQNGRRATPGKGP